VEEVLPFNKFFRIVDMCLSCTDIARQLCDGAQIEIFGDFLHPVFQRAACNTFQTCILNSHTMCGSMADIQLKLRRLRLGKGKKKIEETTGEKHNGLPYSIGRP